MLRPSWLAAVSLLGLFVAPHAAGAAEGEPTREQLDFFERKIRPVLVERCYECHSAKAKELQGKLLLDTREGVQKGGTIGPAVVPGQPDKSLLIEAIGYKNEDLKMPPEKPLSAEQVKDFLLNGNVRNSVNYPDVVMARETAHRLVVANANVPNMLGLISETLGNAKLNIHDMVNRSRGDYAYTVVDLDSPVPEDVRQKIAGINGVLTARII